MKNQENKKWHRELITQTRYSRTHLLKSLTFFDDAEKAPMPDLLLPLDWVRRNASSFGKPRESFSWLRNISTSPAS